VTLPRLRSLLAAIVLPAALLAAVARSGGVDRAKEPAGATRPASPAARPDCAPLPGGPPDVPPRLRDTVGLNFSSAALEAGDSALVEVCALVDSSGVVREVALRGPGTPYDSAAVDAVRWWWFEPARRSGHAVAARIVVPVTVRPPRDADPIIPDVLALAESAEARGDARGAMDAWTGALNRAGIHPAIGNEWVLRARILRIAAGLTPPPAVPLDSQGRALGAHDRMLRDISRATNADLARTLDRVLLAAPWYVDAYRWRAAARAASGQRAGALRDVLCYELAVRDSLGRATADRALARLASGDTLSALTLLKY